jgi:hypothetical protein
MRTIKISTRFASLKRAFHWEIREESSLVNESFCDGFDKKKNGYLINLHVKKKFMFLNYFNVLILKKKLIYF